MLVTSVNNTTQDYPYGTDTWVCDDTGGKPEIKAVAAGNFEEHANVAHSSCSAYRKQKGKYSILDVLTDDLLKYLMHFLPDKDLCNFSQTNSKIYCIAQLVIPLRTGTGSLLDDLYAKFIENTAFLNDFDSESVANAKTIYKFAIKLPVGSYERNDVVRDALAALISKKVEQIKAKYGHLDDAVDEYLQTILKLYPHFYQDKLALNMMFELFDPQVVWIKDKKYAFAFLEAWKIGKIKPKELYIELGSDELELIKAFADAVRRNNSVNEIMLTLGKIEDHRCLGDVFIALKEDRKIEFITIRAEKNNYYIDPSTKHTLDYYCEILNEPETYHSIIVGKWMIKEIGEWASNIFDGINRL